jgi:hypothetical protein
VGGGWNAEFGVQTKRDEPFEDDCRNSDVDQIIEKSAGIKTTNFSVVDF